MRLANEVLPGTTRAAILLAAAQSFAEKGFKQTTLDDIALVAGVSRRAIYHHFSSKLEILEAASVEQAQQFLLEVRHSVKADGDFAKFVGDCLIYVIEKAPHSPLFTLDVSKGSGFDPVSIYFNSPELIAEWVKFFREPYTEALRRREINPQVQLMKLVNWFGRISTSYLCYSLPGESQQEIRDSVNVFLVSALRLNT
jgi:AcrR family transcriptional regulator